jgi:hypothetical protein
MKNIIKYSLVAVVLFFSTSCEKRLEKLNVNTTGFSSLDPILQLNGAIVNASFQGGTLVYEVGIVQQVVSPNGGVLAGANYNVDNKSLGAPTWPTYYRNVIRNTHDIIVGLKTNTLRQNLYHMARIFQAYAFMILTDTYGEIPYTDAGKGYDEAVLFPKYETQQFIYTDIIKELTEATAALNAATATESGDILYAGNIAQWKKFGYSLLLRAGMRLSKIDPVKAAATVTAAVTGGVITANADNAYVRQTSDYQQPIGNTLNGSEAANFYLTKPFVDSLKKYNDPRLPAIAVRYVGATSGPTQTTANQNFTIASQIGMPMGFNNQTVVAQATADGLASFYDYSQVDRRRLVKGASPVFYVTAAQTLLLLAEARERGWITSSTTKAYYDAAVTAHMQQMVTYDPNSAVAAGDITTYLTISNPFNPLLAMQQIGTQYWIASFLNGPEAFANFRRTGYPALAPNPYPGKEITGPFIRRLTYPTSEISVNTANVQAAIARQGADNLETRIWWDKP